MLIEDFHARAEEAGLIPLVAVFADEHSVRRFRNGDRTIHAPLLTFCQENNIECVDIAEAFNKIGGDVSVDDWFMPASHYSPAGNRLVAELIGQTVAELRPGAAKTR
jgi:hypothetical protein